MVVLPQISNKKMSELIFRIPRQGTQLSDQWFPAIAKSYFGKSMFFRSHRHSPCLTMSHPTPPFRSMASDLVEDVPYWCACTVGAAPSDPKSSSAPSTCPATGASRNVASAVAVSYLMETLGMRFDRQPILLAFSGWWKKRKYWFKDCRIQSGNWYGSVCKKVI